MTSWLYDENSGKSASGSFTRKIKYHPIAYLKVKRPSIVAFCPNIVMYFCLDLGEKRKIRDKID